MANVSRLRLAGDWWEGVERFGLPQELVHLLRGLITAELTKSITPEATPRLIRLAKEHLSGGLEVMGTPYDVMVYVPDNTENNRTFFVLVRGYLAGELRRLREF